MATATISHRDGDLDSSGPKAAGVEIAAFVVWTIKSDMCTVYMFLESFISSMHTDFEVALYMGGQNQQKSLPGLLTVKLISLRDLCATQSTFVRINPVTSLRDLGRSAVLLTHSVGSHLKYSSTPSIILSLIHI